MPKLKDMLKRRCDLKQGDSVIVDNVRGVYITSISERLSIITMYNNKKPIYKNINTNEIVKTKRVNDGGLYKHAKKHIMWFNYKINKENKNETRKLH